MEEFYKSRVYQPERLSITSTDDITQLDSDLQTPGFYSGMRMILRNPVLNVKSVQLLRASIPNIAQNIPNDEATFWYYKLADVDGVPEPIAPDKLHCVRLLPTFTPRELAPSGTNYAFNQYFQDYASLLVELKKACLSDPDAGGLGTYFIPNDITFDLSGNLFTFQGLDPTYFYVPAGWADPNLPPAQQFLEDSSIHPYGLTGIPGQPYTLRRTLNTRLGFTFSGQWTNNNLYYLSVRPSPNATNKTPILLANTFADLVFSANFNVFCSIASASGYASSGRQNLLCTVPMNSPTLGVTFFNNVLNNPLTKIVQDIYELQFTFLTDSGKPFLLPSSAIVNLEMGFTFL